MTRVGFDVSGVLSVAGRGLLTQGYDRELGREKAASLAIRPTGGDTRR